MWYLQASGTSCSCLVCNCCSICNKMKQLHTLPLTLFYASQLILLCLSRLQLLQDRQRWLNSCGELTGWLDSTIQSVLQLERSREGFVWSRSAGSNQHSFAECAGLLQHRLHLLPAYEAAQKEASCVSPRCCVYQTAQKDVSGVVFNHDAVCTRLYSRGRWNCVSPQCCVFAF